MNVWRATYRFSFEWLDEPITIGQLSLHPAPPEYGSGCMHYYDFEVDGADKDAQGRALDSARERLGELLEVASLSPREPMVEFVGLALLSGRGLTPQRPSTNFELQPLPLQTASSGTKLLSQVKVTVERLQSLPPNIRSAVGRSLRWQYRAREAPGHSEDRFIYLWIAFNSLYGVGGDRAGSEMQRIMRFVEAFLDFVKVAHPPERWV